MELMEKIVTTFAQTAVTNSVIKTRVTAFVKMVDGEKFVIRHVLLFVIKTRVILIQAIVTAVNPDITE